MTDRRQETSALQKVMKIPQDHSLDIVALLNFLAREPFKMSLRHATLTPCGSWVQLGTVYSLGTFHLVKYL